MTRPVVNSVSQPSRDRDSVGHHARGVNSRKYPLSANCRWRQKRGVPAGQPVPRPPASRVSSRVRNLLSRLRGLSDGSAPCRCRPCRHSRTQQAGPASGARQSRAPPTSPSLRLPSSTHSLAPPRLPPATEDHAPENSTLLSHTPRTQPACHRLKAGILGITILLARLRIDHGLPSGLFRSR